MSELEKLQMLMDPSSSFWAEDHLLSFSLDSPGSLLLRIDPDGNGHRWSIVRPDGAVADSAGPFPSFREAKNNLHEFLKEKVIEFLNSSNL